jgi:hypothetical protein
MFRGAAWDVPIQLPAIYSAVIVRLDRTIRYSTDVRDLAEKPLEYWMPRRSLPIGRRFAPTRWRGMTTESYAWS